MRRTFNHLKDTIMAKITKKDLVEKAKPLSIKGTAKMKKDELIHAIQIAEGNAPCFNTIDDCAVNPCLFREECQD